MVKRKNVLVLIYSTLMVGLFISVFAEMPVFPNTWLTIWASAPPVKLLVIDEQGRKDGIDPNKPLDSVGRGTKIEEIPQSYVEQMNIASDDPATEGEPQPTTGWGVTLTDKPASVYSVVLEGIRDGVSYVGISAGPKLDEKGRINRKVLVMIINAGDKKRFKVSYDPLSEDISKIVNISMEIKPDDLISDIDAVCERGLITQEGICKSLRAKAIAVKKSLDRGNKKAARGQLNALLKELNAQDDKYIKEPALSIIRQDIQFLLQTL